ncbi:MAG: hypothetical protein GY778_21900, partial [bacterium]|nr:hypothetical protein [bacterium]
MGGDEYAGQTVKTPLASHSTIAAIYLAGFTPRAAARACLHLSLIKAYLIHCLAMVMGAVLTLILTALDPYGRGELVLLFDSGVLFTLEGGLAVLACAASIEAIFLLLALLLLPWGDGRASVRSVWRHALRTVWLHTGHMVLAGGVYGCLHVLGDHLLQPEHWQPYRHADHWTLPGDPKMWQWIYSNPEYFLIPIFAAVAVWYLSGLLRAMTIALPAADVPRPPLCEVCGYDLSYHDLSARCPECGRPVVESLGDDVRDHMPWSFRGSRTDTVGFWNASFIAWLKPVCFLTRVPVHDSSRSVGIFLLLHLLLVVPSLWVSACGAELFIFGRAQSLEDLYALLWIGFLIAFLCGCAASLVAAAVGLVVSHHEKRNCLSGALRVAGYCAGLFPIW